MTVFPYCICTTVDARALQALLEASGQGRYKDERPWLIARELLDEAGAQAARLPILFATGHPPEFSHWGFIDSIDVVELHRGKWESLCAFTPLHPVNPIWTPVDSLFLKPTTEQLRRETLEDIPRHRYPLNEGELHPYAICETPAFMLAEGE